MGYSFGVDGGPFGVPYLWSHAATLRSFVALLKKVLEMGDDRRRSWFELALELPEEPLKVVGHLGRGQRRVQGVFRRVRRVRCDLWIQESVVSGHGVLLFDGVRDPLAHSHVMGVSCFPTGFLHRVLSGGDHEVVFFQFVRSLRLQIACRRSLRAKGHGRRLQEIVAVRSVRVDIIPDQSALGGDAKRIELFRLIVFSYEDGFSYLKGGVFGHRYSRSWEGLWTECLDVM